MKKRNLVIIIIAILVLCSIVVIMFISNNKHNTATKSNNNDNNKVEEKTSFKDIYSIENETYNNDENGFNLSVKIVNQIEKTQKLECIRVNVINNDNNVILSSEESLGIYLANKEEYSYSLTDNNQIDINNIKDIEYDFCS